MWFFTHNPLKGFFASINFDVENKRNINFFKERYGDKMRKFLTDRKIAYSYFILALLYGGIAGLLINMYVGANDRLFEIEKASLENEKIQADSNAELIIVKKQVSKNQKEKLKTDEKLVEIEKKISDAEETEWKIKEERLEAQIKREDAVESLYIPTAIALFLALCSMAIPYAMSSPQREINQATTEQQPSEPVQQPPSIPNKDTSEKTQNNMTKSQRNKQNKQNKKKK